MLKSRKFQAALVLVAMILVVFVASAFSSKDTNLTGSLAPASKFITGIERIQFATVVVSVTPEVKYAGVTTSDLVHGGVINYYPIKDGKFTYNDVLGTANFYDENFKLISGSIK